MYIKILILSMNNYFHAAAMKILTYVS